MIAFSKLDNRLCYGVWLVEELLSCFPESVKPYDVACSIVLHLEMMDSQLLENVTFAFPLSHAYGLTPSCKVRISVFLKSLV